ncbi:MAG: hypothetical protein RLY87_250 [Chloroflexota bacterium]
MSNTTLFYLSMALCIPLLGGVVWGWRRWWRDDAATVQQRFLKNSSIPIIANLFGKVLDLGFAAVTLRALGPSASGAWSFVALITSMYLVTIVNWGLNDLAVREAAARPGSAPHVFGVGVTMRWLMALIVVPLTLFGLWLLRDQMPPLSWGTQVALALLLVHLWPAGTAAAVSASFQAAQRMEVPALVVMITSLLRTMSGIALVLWLPTSDARIIAMGSVALGATVLNAVLLWWFQRRLLFRAGPLWDWSVMRRLWVDAVPLLLNSLLMTVFFRFDAIILRAVAGDTVLGLYDAAYKVVSLTQIIPPYVVGALFPLLAQRAVHDRATLNPLLSRAIGVLQVVAWMGVVIVTVMADDMIWLLGGSAYLPEAATALRVLIWYLPLSYTTGVVQYALIAIARQKAITWAFLVGTVINVGGNLLLIPLYGAIAAAVMTTLTEVALLAALWPTLRREGIDVPVRRLLVTGGIAVTAVGLAWASAAVGVPKIPALMLVLSGMMMLCWRLGYIDRAITDTMSRIATRISLRIRK